MDLAGDSTGDVRYKSGVVLVSIELAHLPGPYSVSPVHSVRLSKRNLKGLLDDVRMANRLLIA
jgi:hypothetical protein